MTATYDFKGQTYLVTGAGAGIGKAVCKRLAISNAKIIAVSLIQNELDALEKELPGIRTVQVDLSDWKATRTAIEEVVPVHGLVNNAGIGILASFFDCTEEQWDATYAVNAKAVLNVSQVVVKSMIENGIKGSIVNMSSITALKGTEPLTIYSSSKAALQAMTRVMALELGPHGIRVNTVNPTVVKTGMSRWTWESAELSAPTLKQIPLGRFAEVEDVAAAVLFLLSEDSSTVHGSPLPIDGGHLV